MDLDYVYYGNSIKEIHTYEKTYIDMIGNERYHMHSAFLMGENINGFDIISLNSFMYAVHQYSP